MLTPGHFMGEQDPRAVWARNIGLLSVITVDLVGYSGAGVAIGYLAWKKLGWPWWFLLLTSLAGLSLAMYRVYQFTLREEEKETKKQP
jgi:hypothetical protein